MSTEATPYLDEVQWYTPTRRIPQFVGKPPGGGSYPGGPYTVPQVVGGAAVFVVGMRTQDLWGQGTWLVNQGILLALTIATVVALKFVKPGGRSPLMAGPAAVNATIGAPHGTYRGRKITPPKPTHVRAGVIHARLDDFAPPSTVTTAPVLEQENT